jgi:hypothetical protein
MEQWLCYERRSLLQFDSCLDKGAPAVIMLFARQARLAAGHLQLCACSGHCTMVLAAACITCTGTATGNVAYQAHRAFPPVLLLHLFLL